HPAGGPLADADHRVGPEAGDLSVLELPVEELGVEVARLLEIGALQLDVHEWIGHGCLLTRLQMELATVDGRGQPPLAARHPRFTGSAPGRMASVIRDAAVQNEVLVMQWSPRHVPSSRWMPASRARMDLLHFVQSSPPPFAKASVESR